MNKCYYCKKEVIKRSSCVTLMGTIFNGSDGTVESYTITNHIYFHGKCFEAIAGKEYTDVVLHDPNLKKKPKNIDVDKEYKKMAVRSSLPNPFPNRIVDGHVHWFIGWDDYSDICDKCGLIKVIEKPTYQDETHYPPHRE